jgi:hypothetical protein
MVGHEGEIMSNLLRLPPSTNMTAEQALASALVDAEDGDLTDVIIIGYRDGEIYVRSSRLTCAEGLFLANKAMRWAEAGGEL